MGTPPAALVQQLFEGFVEAGDSVEGGRPVRVMSVRGPPEGKELQPLFCLASDGRPVRPSAALGAFELRLLDPSLIDEMHRGCF